MICVPDGRQQAILFDSKIALQEVLVGDPTQAEPPADILGIGFPGSDSPAQFLQSMVIGRNGERRLADRGDEPLSVLEHVHGGVASGRRRGTVSREHLRDPILDCHRGSGKLDRLNADLHPRGGMRLEERGVFVLNGFAPLISLPSSSASVPSDIHMLAIALASPLLKALTNATAVARMAASRSTRAAIGVAFRRSGGAGFDPVFCCPLRSPARRHRAPRPEPKTAVPLPNG